MPSFTVSATGTLRELVSPCKIAPAYNPKSPGDIHPDTHDFRVIWDTGATNSVISARVVAACGLKPVGMSQVENANATHVCPVYLVNIMLPNATGFVAHRVTQQNLGKVDALIGMDIIGGGDFAVTCQGGKTVFSFRYPSAKCIDFVKDDKTPDIASPQQHRNAKCACGSGKKYKNCHGDPRNFPANPT